MYCEGDAIPAQVQLGEHGGSPQICLGHRHLLHLLPQLHCLVDHHPCQHPVAVAAAAAELAFPAYVILNNPLGQPDTQAPEYSPPDTAHEQ